MTFRRGVFSSTAFRTDEPGAGGPPPPPQENAVDIEIFVNDVDIVADVSVALSWFENHANGQAGSCEIWIKDLGHSASFQTGKKIRLVIDGQNEWQGYVAKVRRRYAFPVDRTTNPTLTPRWIVLVGEDINILFARRFFYNKAHPERAGEPYPKNTADSTVIADMVANFLDLSDDDLDTTSGVTTVGNISLDNVAYPFEPAMSWGEGMRLTAQLTSALYCLDPDRVLQYVAADVPTAPFDLSDQPDYISTFGYREITVIDDGSGLANDALVWGAGLGSKSTGFGRAQDAASIAEHGRWQWADYRPDMYRDVSLTLRAFTYLYGTVAGRGHKDNVVSSELIVFKPGLRVGQVVRVTSNALEFYELLPIRSMHITFPASTADGKAFVEYRITPSRVIDDPWATAEFGIQPQDRPEAHCQPLANTISVSTNQPIKVVARSWLTGGLGLGDIGEWLPGDDLDPIPGSSGTIDDSGGAGLYPFWHSWGTYGIDVLLSSPSNYLYDGCTIDQNMHTLALPHPIMTWVGQRHRRIITVSTPSTLSTGMWESVRITGKLLVEAAVTAVDGVDLRDEVPSFDWELRQIKIGSDDLYVEYPPTFGTASPDSIDIDNHGFEILASGTHPGGNVETDLDFEAAITTEDGSVSLMLITMSPTVPQVAYGYVSAGAPFVDPLEIITQVPYYNGGVAEYSWPSGIYGGEFSSGHGGFAMKMINIAVTFKGFTVPSGSAVVFTNCYSPDSQFCEIPKWKEDNIYETLRDYVSDSMSVFYQGKRQTMGVDYEMTDSENGLFEFLAGDNTDLSDDLSVCYYVRDPQIFPLAKADPHYNKHPGYIGFPGYHPRFLSQFGWGTEFDSANCTCAAAAMWLDAVTGGGTLVIPPDIRDHQSDFVGGISLSDAAVALAFYGQTLGVHTGDEWPVFVAALVAGPVMMAGSYSAITAAYSSQLGFTGGHSMMALCFSDTKRHVLVYDPLNVRQVWMPVNMIRSYMSVFTGGAGYDFGGVI